MAYETLKLEERDAIAVVTVNRPDKFNALNTQVIAELADCFTTLRSNAAIRAVILTGAGEMAFIAGADISVLAELDPQEARENAMRGQRLTELIENLGKPVIAAVNGFALGGGCELAMACTLRIASENAKFGQPEVKLGIIPGYGGSQRLPRLVGKGRALELILTGEHIDAQEAWRIGLVNRVVKRDQLLAEAESVARKILAVAPVAVRYSIEAVNGGLETPLTEGLALEANLFGMCFTTRDMKEGTGAFLEKRPPKFTGK
ncbi:MAG: enoyl-CoA hydratase/isomerase family protein [Planctomycetes bacterium]|nr:enoyl-CoA hydratase/isomerase family protein [Planctomycetota bacterium]